MKGLKLTARGQAVALVMQVLGWGAMVYGSLLAICAVVPA